MHKIMAIAWNMVKRTIGSRKGILIHILVPALVVAGIIFITGGMEGSNPVLLYGSQDTGTAGSHLLTELEKTGGYTLKEAGDEAALKEAVIAQEGMAGIWIPADYTQEMLQGTRPELSLYELRTSEDSILVKMNIDTIVSEMTAAAELIQAAGPDGAAAQTAQFAAVLEQAGQHHVGSIRTDYDLYPRETLGVATGLTLMFLMNLVSSTVTQILRDRTGRTMMRMYSAPVRAYEITLGNFLGSCLVGFIQIFVVLALGKWVLRYDYEVSMPFYFLVLATFMLVAMGIAATIAGLVRNPMNAGMINMLILTPTCMLGGCFWPLSVMPDYMQKAANFVPQKWAIQAVDMASTGGGWDVLWQPFAVLGLMAAILLVLGSSVLRPNEAGIGA
ncbi:ABC transporter permease ['Paenibacillus yunnanensis' Narsing Rao et al. 2020]|uniref:ABC transporter permease n=1 Tax=Paenibacillus tengchongensis TaxID=2608684 RepID=UPI00124C71B2|nr:ABC transporter permease [Paenibacillus tengchongensis]